VGHHRCGHRVVRCCRSGRLGFGSSSQAAIEEDTADSKDYRSAYRSVLSGEVSAEGKTNWTYRLQIRRRCTPSQKLGCCRIAGSCQPSSPGDPRSKTYTSSAALARPTKELMNSGRHVVECDLNEHNEVV
jgi:hypothetical protein